MFLEWIYKNELRDWDWHVYTAAAAKSLQSCPTLRDPIDGSSPGSPVPGILQARTLEWVAISFSNAWKWKVEVKSLSRVQLLAIPWTAAYQAPPSMGFSIGVHYTIFSEFEICYYKKVLKSHHFLQKSVPLPSTPYKAHTHVCYCPVPTVSHESHPWNFLCPSKSVTPRG